MLRTGASRKLGQSLLNRSSFTSSAASKHHINGVASRALSFKSSSQLALAPYQPVATSLLRYASTTITGDKIRTKHEQEVARQPIKPDPEHVSTESSTRHILSEEGVEEVEKDVDMMAGIRSDLKTIRETFSLQDVPKEALTVGMAGIVPYLATSLSTVFLAWNISHAAATGTGLFMSGKTAELALHVIEPIQIGYGACIISFLGAIHWGLEWAKFGGEHGYSRYIIGVIAPAIAWPTMFMPIEYALISQFLAFNYLYYWDSRAARAGWAPRWYGVYRYVLTFVVGASIVVTLIGRGQVFHEIERPHGTTDRVKALRASQYEQLEDEERARNASIVKKRKDEDEDEEDDE